MYDNVFSERGDGEPSRKKSRKNSGNKEIDPVFTSLREPLKDMLSSCCDAVDCGLSKMNLELLIVKSANASVCVSFSYATCETEKHIQNDNTPVRSVIGSLFVEGMQILNKYFKQDKIPKGAEYRTALSKLLKFVTEDHTPLLEDRKKLTEGEWAVRVGQHLLSRLSVHESYVMAPYKGCKFESTCPCAKHDNLVGYIGDTSFGCEYGWHGSPDFIIQDVAVSVLKEATKEESDPSSIEIKGTDSISRQGKSQLKAQTITFSALQAQHNLEKLRNSLVPGVLISTMSVLVNFYDTTEDVLLSSQMLDLFDEGQISFTTVIFLWLTLNYRLFCSGLREGMKQYKSKFFSFVDMDTFKKNTKMPMHIKQDDELNPNTPNPGRKFDPAPPSIIPESEFIDIKPFNQ